MSLKTLLKTQKMLNQPMPRAKRRNLSALNPLLKKGGVHDKDNPKTRHKKERKNIKLFLKKSY